MEALAAPHCLLVLIGLELNAHQTSNHWTIGTLAVTCKHMSKLFYLGCGLEAMARNLDVGPYLKCMRM